MATALAVALLAAVLIFASVRPRGLPEVVVAVPAAAILLATGVVSWHEARADLAALGPTVGFLAAVLVLAHAADRAGVFTYTGALAARWGGTGARRLLTVVFGVAAVITAVLSLDATVVLLTPVVLSTAEALRVRPKPHLFACAHLANSASLLLPVSNLTNLLAFAASGLGFLRFAELMALPWLITIGVEYVIFRRFFRRDLTGAAAPQPDRAVAAPRFALVVLGLTLVGFVALEPVGVRPAWVALGGALAIGVRDIASAGRGNRARTAGRLLAASNPAFCAFVFALGIVVATVAGTGIGHAVGSLVPASTSPLALLGLAALAAVLANVLNNLPATLLLVPLVAHSPALVLAVLIGVDIGPNLTYVGSLATLLWREVLHTRDHSPDTGTFLRLGALTVPTCLVAATAALWLGLRVTGTA